jgi:peptidoglycan/LPS O-acetylase OafA/YrhL
MVLIGHLIMMVWPATLVTEVYPPGAPAWQLMVAASPVSALWDGRLAVSIFFILSGYVLTAAVIARPLSFAALAGKRYVRLALPVLAATIPTLLLYPPGLYFNHELAYAAGSAWLDSVTSVGFHPGILGWLRNAFWVVFFVDGHTSYNAVLWTMRFEWYGSLLVFLSVSLLRHPGLRLVVAAALLLLIADLPVYVYLHLFFAGMILHDLTILSMRCPSVCKVPPVFLNGFGLLLAAMGLYLPRLVMVAIDQHAGAFACLLWLRHAMPNWQGDRWMLAAIAVVVGVQLSPFLRRGLSRSFCQFFGRISFPLYLFHLPLILSLGCWLMLLLLPRFTPAVAIAGTFGVTASIAILVAWLMTLLVEQPTLRLSARVGVLVESGWRRLWPRHKQPLPPQSV